MLRKPMFHTAPVLLTSTPLPSSQEAISSSCPAASFMGFLTIKTLVGIVCKQHRMTKTT